MNNYNFHSNIFFLVNNYYIYLLNPQNTLKYNFFYLNQDYFLQIYHKLNQPLNIFFKLLNINNNCYYYNIYHEKNNLIKLNNFDKINFHHKHKDNIIINPSLLEFIKHKYPLFEYNSYNQNLFKLSLNQNNINFLYYNWYYFGKLNKFQYFKYIIYKNKYIFHEIYQKINYFLDYDVTKKYSLIFIDDRFDNIFEYILITFLYSLDNKWNLYIYTCKEHFEKYQIILNNLKIQATLYEISPFQNVNNYSNFLKTNSFWESILEDYVLIFQYDTIAFLPFQYKFLKYHYIGAQWPEHIQQIKGIYNGNGGLSLRNVETMKLITSKYNYILVDEENTPEDKYFSKYLMKENLLMNDPNICDEFSFENSYNDNSIFGHAIYECIELNKLENYIMNRLRKLLFI